MPKLFHFTLDPFCRRVRLALAEFGQTCSFHEEKPWQPSAEWEGLGAMSALPIFIEDDGLMIQGIESLSEYLEETKANLTKLLPGSAELRAEIRRLVTWFDVRFYADVSEPIISEKAIKRFLPPEQGGGAPDMNRVRFALQNLKNHLLHIEELLQQRDFLAGNDFSYADLAAMAHLTTIEYLGDLDFSQNSAVLTWYQRIKSRPSFRSLLKDVVPAMPPSANYARLDY